MVADENLLSRFLKDEDKTDELECFLTTLGSASQVEKGNIEFPWLEVEYKKNGREIKAIRSLDPHSPNILAGLEAKVDEAIYADHGTHRQSDGSVRSVW